MFKRGFKKVLCSGLVLGLLLGLTACGKQKEEETVSGWGEDNTALAREFVYGEEILKIPKYRQLPAPESFWKRNHRLP